MVVKEEYAVLNGFDPRFIVRFFQFIFEENYAVGIDALPGFWRAYITGLLPLNKGFVVIFLLFVAHVDTDRFFAQNLLLLSVPITILTHQVEGGRNEKSECDAEY